MIKRWLITAVFLLLIFPQVTIAGKFVPFVTKNITIETLKEVQKGGFVLYMRHAPTDTSHPDRVPHVDLNDCSTQRVLSEEGRNIAVEIGEAIRKAAIPIGEIQVSPMCRTKETAEAAFGKKYTLNIDLMYTSNLTSKEKEPKIVNSHRLLSTPVSAGTNLVLVAHAPNLMDVMGYFVKPEGTVVVFKPLGEKGFEYVASITPKQWQGLLSELGK